VLAAKVVVVTGGAGLLGRSFVRGILDRGWTVIVADIDEEASKSVVDSIGCNGQTQIEATKVDITSKESIGDLIALVRQRYGKIDALVNNAYPRNKNYGCRLEDVTYENFCDNVNNHLGGYFLVAQQFCNIFKTQGHGNLINMSSIYGSMTPRFEVYNGTPMTMPVEYAAIKAAIEHLTRYFAQYFKGTGIRVNSLSPGGILANQPMAFLDAYNAHCASKGVLSADDVVGTLLFLLSDESRYITGQNLLVDDGFSL
jgi:NAD(P)-dependent dehydrogenase (short-subunit alcohol dehydrogenase family)